MRLTENYLSIPRRLLIELRDTPLAIAIYFFAARLYLVLQKPVDFKELLAWLEAQTLESDAEQDS